MQINFSKYHGAGNDFILIDNRNGIFAGGTSEIKLMCDRHFGIGADGLILLCKSEHYDFEMKYYNSDGTISTFCGNGSRCVAYYAYTLGIAGKIMTFSAADGIHEAHILENRKVLMQMRDVKITVKSDMEFLADTGSPHIVIFSENLDQTDVRKKGSAVRYSEEYRTKGINVNFAELKEEILHVRTYERGVEDETLSCGTGVTASALSAALFYKLASPVKVITKGGEFAVNFSPGTNKDFTKIELEGPVEFVFSGNYFINGKHETAT